MNLLAEPLLTSEMGRDDLLLEAGSVYIRGSGVEDRSKPEAAWEKRMEAGGAFFWVVDDAGAPDEISIGARRLRLRDKNAVVELLAPLSAIYLDITGLSYAAWAPLVRAAIELRKSLQVVYIEPLDYRRSAAPFGGMLYDLSEGIDGIAPLPGFASLRRSRKADNCLVPLLGFEGARLAHILEVAEPATDRVVPVIGLPGFRPEFPTSSLVGNRTSLESDFMHTRIRYAKANCPFDLFHTLHTIESDYPGVSLRVAPIGTKPHGLGAVLFALSRPDNVEIVYDNPRRKNRRTVGASRVCVYDVGTFIESSIFNPGV